MQLTEDIFRKFGMGRVFKVLVVYDALSLQMRNRRQFPTSHLLQNYQGRINSVDFHRSDDLLITAGEDDAIRLYNTQTGMEIQHLFSKKHGVCNLCYTHAPHAVVHASNKVMIHICTPMHVELTL